MNVYDLIKGCSSVIVLVKKHSSIKHASLVFHNLGILMTFNGMNFEMHYMEKEISQFSAFAYDKNLRLTLTADIFKLERQNNSKKVNFLWFLSEISVSSCIKKLQLAGKSFLGSHTV